MAGPGLNSVRSQLATGPWKFGFAIVIDNLSRTSIPLRRQYSTPLEFPSGSVCEEKCLILADRTRLRRLLRRILGFDLQLLYQILQSIQEIRLAGLFRVPILPNDRKSKSVGTQLIII